MNLSKIREFRESKGWSQEKLSIESGVPQSTISRIENKQGKRGASFSQLKKIAAALGTSVTEISEDEDEEKKSA